MACHSRTGWAIYPVDSETFMSTGALENVNVQHEHILAPSPPADQTAGDYFVTLAGTQGALFEPDANRKSKIVDS